MAMPTEDVVPDFIAMPVAEIRNGAALPPGIQPGWTLGDFFPAADLRKSAAFELKEWDRPLIQLAWKRHEDVGSEYIHVTSGTLTVVFGGRGETPTELSRLALSADHAIVLASGVWRRYEATDDVTGFSARGFQLRVPDVDAGALYAAYSEHWKHTDQIRQWLLYNFLMTSSVTVLAWAALYDRSRLLDGIISGLGIVISMFWLLITNRANGYYTMYEELSREVERQLPSADKWPFHQRHAHRRSRVWWQRATAAMLIQGVPALFGAFFLVTLAINAFSVLRWPIWKAILAWTLPN
jgi:hypothetical protein